ncbi:uncharacterized protein BXZ73DRAFT_107467 [Epithele typhae]|uniref:uncharacterized protein n=1 Tax=Epithele typhae TaxID=378194 RepID=UPI00200742A6|nr:uncharacterized protein BXZ73DRAFT_107467 [Epithele typhae]KAH9912417.1 hypothetical protein BXZ73DRAFT_107467 [Epithele typhae]
MTTKYSLRVLVPSPVDDAEIPAQYEDILDVSFADWETKTAPKKLIQQVVPRTPQLPISYSTAPPVAAESLPPWVFFVDHYSTATSVPIPKVDIVRALPSTFRSAIHPGDRGTPLPLWLLDLWRRLRNVHTVRSNVERGMEWVSEYGRQEDVNTEVIERDLEPILELPALLHPWCDLFSQLTTDDCDLNDDLMDAVVAVVRNNIHVIPRPFHIYSAIVTQLSPVALLDLFGRLAARGDFTTDSVICLPWRIRGDWIVVLIDIPGDEIRIGHCVPENDHDGILEIAKRTAIRIAHTVEVSVRQTHTDWFVHEYFREAGPFPSGLAVAVALLSNIFDCVKAFSRETEPTHRIEVFYGIVEHYPIKPVIVEDHKLSLWEIQGGARSVSLPATSDEKDCCSPSPGVDSAFASSTSVEEIHRSLSPVADSAVASPTILHSPPVFTRTLAHPSTPLCNPRHSRVN